MGYAVGVIWWESKGALAGIICGNLHGDEVMLQVS